MVHVYWAVMPSEYAALEGETGRCLTHLKTEAVMRGNLLPSPRYCSYQRKENSS